MNFTQSNYANLGDAIKCITNPTYFRLLQILKQHDELCQRDLLNLFNKDSKPKVADFLSQATLVKIINDLEDAELIETYKQGKFLMIRINIRDLDFLADLADMWNARNA